MKLDFPQRYWLPSDYDMVTGEKWDRPKWHSREVTLDEREDRRQLEASWQEHRRKS